MANHKSALKRHRQSVTKSARNRGYRTQIKNVTKSVTSAVETKNSGEAQKALNEAMKTISKIASKGVIHKRAAARKIAGLSRQVHGLSAGA